MRQNRLKLAVAFPVVLVGCVGLLFVVTIRELFADIDRALSDALNGLVDWTWDDQPTTEQTEKE